MSLLQLGDICRFEYGASLPNQERTHGDVIVFGSNGPVGKHQTSFTYGKTIIIGRKGSIGKIHFSNKSCWPIDTTYYIDENCTETDLEWLCYALRHLKLSNLNKASGVPGLNRDDAYKQFVRVPNSKKEQSLIASHLKKQLAEVETAQHASKLQLDETAALLTAYYRDAFQQIVPIATGPKFVEAPAGWAWHKLTDIARLESGHTPSRARPDWWGGDVSWISLTEIRALDGQWVETTRLRTNEQGIANSAARILPIGTVCFSRTASVGFVTIMSKPMATSQDFANWVCSSALDPEFLMYGLISARKELRELATGATHKTIYMPTLESFHICIPTPDAQRKIVRGLKDRLLEIERIKTALLAQKNELDALPQRLLAQAFEPQVNDHA